MNNPSSPIGTATFRSDFSTPAVQNQPTYGTHNAAPSSKRMKRFFKKSPFIPFLLVGIVVLIVAGIAVKNLTANNKSSQGVLSSDTRTNVDKAVAVDQLNKTFNFPLKDATGKVVSQLSYEIQNAELRNTIIVKGQQATAVKGRTFLILNIKITNSFDKSVQLNTKDYIRLIVNGSTEKLAADIHNDPVDVQAISTKYTRLGFPINDNEKDLTLQVGEISGKKELIKLNLK